MLAIKQVPIDTDLQEIIKEISIMQQCDSHHVVKYYGSYFKDSDLWVSQGEVCGLLLFLFSHLPSYSSSKITACYTSRAQVCNEPGSGLFCPAVLIFLSTFPPTLPSHPSSSSSPHHRPTDRHGVLWSRVSVRHHEAAQEDPDRGGDRHGAVRHSAGP